jgi:hypothetical protein
MKGIVQMSEEQEEYQTGQEIVVTSQATREIDFYGDLLLVSLVDDVPYVAVKPIVDYLEIDWSSQLQRINRDEILSEAKRKVVMVAGDGKRREMVSLPLELFHGWLFTITGTRLKTTEAVKKLNRYRRDCFRVLWREFGRDWFQPTEVLPGPGGSQALVQVREIGQALVNLADEQLVLQTRVDTIETSTAGAHERLDKAAAVVRSMQQRLSHVERRVYPYECISEEMATEIRLAVQRLAEALTRRAVATLPPGEKLPNYYSGIFTEIYTRTGAPRYELIRVEDYSSVMAFLESWRRSTLGEV